MNSKLNEILLRRGRLQERIASQRESMRRDAQPVSLALEKLDCVLASVRSATDYMKRNPAVVAAAVAGLFLIDRKRFWSWAKRGVVAWKAFRTVRNRLLAFGIRG